MLSTLARLTRLAALAATALAAAGCGDKCPTETPKVQRVESCTVSPGTPVSVRLETCPTCNQIATSCDVDLSQLGPGSNQIFLDPLAEACDPAGSCPDPSCQVNGLTCTFDAPATAGQYELVVYDPSTNTTKRGTLGVVSSGALSCAF
jgi:hypothetical protein